MHVYFTERAILMETFLHSKCSLTQKPVLYLGLPTKPSAQVVQYTVQSRLFRQGATPCFTCLACTSLVVTVVCA